MKRYFMKLEDCPVVKDEKMTIDLFFEVIEGFMLHIRAVTEKKAYPFGGSISAILANGHVTMHTFPARERLDIDFYCRELPSDFREFLMREFRAKSLKFVIVDEASMRVEAEGVLTK